MLQFLIRPARCKRLDIETAEGRQQQSVFSLLITPGGDVPR